MNELVTELSESSVSGDQVEFIRTRIPCGPE